MIQIVRVSTIYLVIHFCGKTERYKRHERISKKLFKAKNCSRGLNKESAVLIIYKARPIN